MLYYETCKKDLNIITKTSHFKSTILIENEVISRTNNHLSDRTFIFLNPEFDHLYGLVENTFDDCEKKIHGIKNKRVFIVFSSCNKWHYELYHMKKKF